MADNQGSILLRNFAVAETGGYPSSCVSNAELPFTAIVSILTSLQYLVTSTVLTTEVLAVSDPLVVYWRENDLSVFPTDVRSSLEAVMRIDPRTTDEPSVTATSSEVSSPTASPAADDNSESLSRGVIGGIAAGAAVVVLILFLLLFRAWRKRRQRKPDFPDEEKTEKGTQKNPADLPYVSELSADAALTAELGELDPSNPRRTELPAIERLAELPADEAPIRHRQDRLRSSLAYGKVDLRKSRPTSIK